MKYGRLVLVFMASVTSAFAGISAKQALEIQFRADEYFAGRVEIVPFNTDPAPSCLPSPQACIVFVAGAYPSTEQRIAASKACVANYGDTCVKWAAGSYPSYDQRIAGARACRNNRTTECAVFVAGSYPSYDQRVASVASCGNAEIACVKYVAGSYPSYDERVAAAKSCSDSE